MTFSSYFYKVSGIAIDMIIYQFQLYNKSANTYSKYNFAILCSVLFIKGPKLFFATDISYVSKYSDSICLE